MRSGLEKIRPLLGLEGFRFEPGDEAASSGGAFATCVFRRGSLQVGLIVRNGNQLGCPNYSAGHGYAGHDDVIWALGRDGKAQLVLRGRSYTAADGGDPFDALATDLRDVILPALRKSEAAFSAAIARAHRKFQKSLKGRPSRYVALLRGVNNVGAARRVAMADLRTLFESLGFFDVRTLLNSGNVVFSVRNKGRREVRDCIQRALASRLGLSSDVIILSAREVTAAVRDNPLSRVATNPSHLLVLVPQVKSGLLRLEPLLDQRWAPELLALGRRVAYLWCAKGVAKSPLWAAVDRALERKGTVRNIATFTKAAALVERAPP